MKNPRFVKSNWKKRRHLQIFLFIFWLLARLTNYLNRESQSSVYGHQLFFTDYFFFILRRPDFCSGKPDGIFISVLVQTDLFWRGWFFCFFRHFRENPQFLKDKNFFGSKLKNSNFYLKNTFYIFDALFKVGLQKELLIF